MPPPTTTSPLSRCPSCGLSLPDDPDQRDKRCPDCLRTGGKAVFMQAALTDATATSANAAQIEPSGPR